MLSTVRISNAPTGRAPERARHAKSARNSAPAPTPDPLVEPISDVKLPAEPTEIIRHY